MTARALRKLCLGFPGAVEEFPFNPSTSVFKVEGKIFAISALGGQPLDVSLKCDPPLAEQLRASHAGDPPGLPPEQAALEHGHVLDGSLADAMVRDLVEDSYDLVVSAMSRARREALGWSPDAA